MLDLVSSRALLLFTFGGTEHKKHDKARFVAHLTFVIHLFSSTLCAFSVKSHRKFFIAFILCYDPFSSLADCLNSRSLQSPACDPQT